MIVLYRLYDNSHHYENKKAEGEMDLEIRWHKAFDLKESKKSEFIYEVNDFEAIPNSPGIYYFARAYADSISPLYIGQAINLQQRVKQQLNSLKLMRGIQHAPSGDRLLFVAEFIPKPGQSTKKALSVIESALISTALVEGFELINVHGKKKEAHSIASRGNLEARSWLPENVIRLRRA